MISRYFARLPRTGPETLSAADGERSWPRYWCSIIRVMDTLRKWPRPKPKARAARVPRCTLNGCRSSYRTRWHSPRTTSWTRLPRSNLLMVGVNTNVCVESTLRDAYHREYFAIMVADATFQSGPAAMMDATIFNVEKFFGWVSTVDEICRAL